MGRVLWYLRGALIWRIPFLLLYYINVLIKQRQVYNDKYSSSMTWHGYSSVPVSSLSHMMPLLEYYCCTAVVVILFDTIPGTSYYNTILLLALLNTTVLLLLLPVYWLLTVALLLYALSIYVWQVLMYYWLCWLDRTRQTIKKVAILMIWNDIDYEWYYQYIWYGTNYEWCDMIW